MGPGAIMRKDLDTDIDIDKLKDPSSFKLRLSIIDDVVCCHNRATSPTAG